VCKNCFEADGVEVKTAIFSVSCKTIVSCRLTNSKISSTIRVEERFAIEYGDWAKDVQLSFRW